MERTTSIAEAKKIFGNNFAGPDELAAIAGPMGIARPQPQSVPPIPFAPDELAEKASNHVLILSSRTADGQPITLSFLRDHFGTDPQKKEPCFYDQNWYLKELFMRRELPERWFLVRKFVIEESRAQAPDGLAREHTFPSAVLCAYTFFVFSLLSSERLWKNDFIWCDDTDHNKDRIYVGRYEDPDRMNKNGFNVHRHLSIRKNYGCIDVT